MSIVNKRQLPLKAITFAAKSHKGQLRKDNKTPYIAHPFRVMTILSDLFGVKDEEVLAVGILHDTIEDTHVDKSNIAEKFGERVANYVDTLSKDTKLEKKRREQLYAQELENAPVEVKLCKLADIYDNISHIKPLSHQKRLATVRRAEKLCTLMTKNFPQKWQNAVLIVENKIKALKKELNLQEEIYDYQV